MERIWNATPDAQNGALVRANELGYHLMHQHEKSESNG